MRRAAEIVNDAQWFAHRYDPQFDAFHFVRLSRADHAKATFVTDEHLPQTLEKEIVARDEAIACMPNARPIHFIFHSAFCCSTLLARAFDSPGLASVWKEPPLFNDIIGWRHRDRAPGARVAQVLDQSVMLLARPFERDEAVVLKPSNLINPLARAILSMRPESNAILLHAPLGIYLRSIVKKEMTGRLWVRQLLVALLKEGAINLGFSNEDYLGLTDLQVAAVGWLAQQALFQELSSEFGQNRIRSVTSENLLGDPRRVVFQAARHFRLLAGPTLLDQMAGEAVFRTHSKTGKRYGAEDRLAEYDNAAEPHQDELTKVERWAEVIAENAGVTMMLPEPLILGS